MRSGRLAIATALAVFVVTPAAAQSDVPGGSVAVLGGGAATTSTAGPLLGGTLLFDVNNRLALEGQAAWFSRGSGTEAFTLNASVLVNLIPLGSRAVPYASAGGGLYRASFDMAHAQLLGALGAQFRPGAQFCPAAGSGYMRGPGPSYGDCLAAGGGMWGVGDMPRFYASRLGMLTVPPTGAWGTRTFTDPVLTLGGGVRIGLAEHLELRPDVRAIIVLGGGSSQTVGVFGVNIGYRF